MRILRWGTAAAMLLWAGAANAGPLRAAELGTVMLDADNGKLSGDLEVDGELVGTFEYRIGRAQFVDGKVVMTGTLTARVENAASMVGNVRIGLLEPEEVCKSLTASTGELPLEAIGLVVHTNNEIDVDFIARTSHGRTIGALLCAATHASDLSDRQLLPQFASVLTSLASRSVGLAAHAPSTGGGAPIVERAAPAQAQVVAPPQTVVVQPPAPVVVQQPQYPVSAPQPAVIEVQQQQQQPASRRRPQPQRRLPAPPPANDPTSDEAQPSGY